MLSRMLSIDFKAPMEVAITFEDSDEEVVDVKKEINPDDCSENVNKEDIIDEVVQENVLKQDNFKNIEKVEPKKDCTKTNFNVETENNISRKRKMSSQEDDTIPPTDEHGVKHTVITTSHGQTHIIVAPLTNTSPPSNDHNIKYLESSLKTVSESLLIIMEAREQWSKYEKNNKAEADKLLEEVRDFYFNLSYSTTVSVIVPQENDMLFVTRFLKDTLRLCKERNKIPIQNEQQIFPVYNELLEWTKKKQKTLEEMQSNPLLKFSNTFKETIKSNESLRPARPNMPVQSTSQFNLNSTNTSDISNAELRALLQPQNQGRNANIINNTVSSETGVLNAYLSLNGQANTPQNGQMNHSSAVPNNSRSMVPPLNNSGTNAILRQLPNKFTNCNKLNLPTTPSSQSQYQHLQLGRNQPSQPTQGYLSQMVHNGTLLPQQQQTLHPISNYIPNAYQQSQYSLSTVNRNSQNYIQHNVNSASTRGIPSNTVPKAQNVSGNTKHAQRNVNANFTAQAWHMHRVQGLGINQNGSGNVPMANPTYQNNAYAQNTQWAPNKPPPPYEANYWQAQGLMSNNKEQQQQQQQQTPRRMSATRQHQADPQQPEAVRSMSTDSGIMSPLPFGNPTDATNNDILPEEHQQPPFVISHVTSLNPNVSYISEGKCAICNKSTNLKCLCFKKYYCSYDCQKNDWNTHKITCSGAQSNPDPSNYA